MRCNRRQDFGVRQFRRDWGQRRFNRPARSRDGRLIRSIKGRLFCRGVAVQADGKILVGGIFHGIYSIGGQARDHIARLDPNTGLADSFDRTQTILSRQLQSRPTEKSWRLAVSPRWHRTMEKRWRATASPAWKPTAGSTRRSISALSDRRSTPPPFNRTARSLSAATLPVFWAYRATTSPG